MATGGDRQRMAWLRSSRPVYDRVEWYAGMVFWVAFAALVLGVELSVVLTLLILVARWGLRAMRRAG